MPIATTLVLVILKVMKKYSQLSYVAFFLGMALFFLGGAIFFLQHQESQTSNFLVEKNICFNRIRYEYTASIMSFKGPRQLQKQHLDTTEKCFKNLAENSRNIFSFEEPSNILELFRSELLWWAQTSLEVALNPQTEKIQALNKKYAQLQQLDKQLDDSFLETRFHHAQWNKGLWLGVILSLLGLFPFFIHLFEMAKKTKKLQESSQALNQVILQGISFPKNLREALEEWSLQVSHCSGDHTCHPIILGLYDDYTLLYEQRSLARSRQPSMQQSLSSGASSVSAIPIASYNRPTFQRPLWSEKSSLPFLENISEAKSQKPQKEEEILIEGPFVFLQEVFSSVLDAHLAKIMSKGIFLDLEVPENIRVKSSYEQMEQIFYHLFSGIISSFNTKEQINRKIHLNWSNSYLTFNIFGISYLDWDHIEFKIARELAKDLGLNVSCLLELEEKSQITMDLSSLLEKNKKISNNITKNSFASLSL